MVFLVHVNREFALCSKRADDGYRFRRRFDPESDNVADLTGQLPNPPPMVWSMGPQCPRSMVTPEMSLTHRLT